ncbi:MAG: hypothetical protein LUC45_04595 [Paraprevotella sp.]|nr:hypothetical protein [Paraprevotella sp.]
MIRTFHSKINKKMFLGCLLPGTVLAVCFFWMKQPVAALCFMVFLVFVIERLIHTMYVFTDDGRLFIHQGRFSKDCKLCLSDIEKAEIIRASSLAFLKNRHSVMLTMQNGSIIFITPFPAEEFCKYFDKKKKEATTQSLSAEEV